MSHRKLFIPGPVEVAPEILAAMGTPMVGHRGNGFIDLYKAVQPMLQEALSTKQPVLLFTASATGVWEMCARNLVSKGCLHLTNGAFSERWTDVTKLNGKHAEALAVEWGMANDDMAALEAKLATGKFDAVAFCHSETSTGVLNPLEKIAAVVKKFPDVFLLVDAVSSLTTLPIETDKLGVDVLLAGVQKGFGLPPGLAVASISERCFARAATLTNRGYYFDLIEAKSYHDKHQTPSTPAISQIFALKKQLERMRAEGFENRYARHRRMAEMAWAWAKEMGLEVFPAAKYATIGLTCFKNTIGFDVEKVAARMSKEHASVLDKGYGKIKGKTFRVAHMGDTTEKDLRAFFGALGEVIRQEAGAAAKA